MWRNFCLFVPIIVLKEGLNENMNTLLDLTRNCVITKGFGGQEGVAWSVNFKYFYSLPMVVKKTACNGGNWRESLDVKSSMIEWLFEKDASACKKILPNFGRCFLSRSLHGVFLSKVETIRMEA